MIIVRVHLIIVIVKKKIIKVVFICEDYLPEQNVEILQFVCI